MRNSRYTTSDGVYLAISDESEGYCIGWYDPGEGEFGLMLGERSGDEETSVVVAALIASKIETEKSRLGVLVFRSRSLAKRALQIANAALTAHAASRPMPDWAATALAAGWTAPRGWHP